MSVVDSARSGQQRAKPGHGMFDNASEHIGEPRLRGHVVQPGGLEQGVDDSGSLPAAIGAAKQPRLPVEGHAVGARSAALLVRQIRPSSRKRVKGCN